MAKTKQIKPTDVAATRKQSPVILANYKPLPRFGSACTNCK